MECESPIFEYNTKRTGKCDGAFKDQSGGGGCSGIETMQLMDCGNGSQINVYTFPVNSTSFVVVVPNHLGDVAAEEEVVARGVSL